MSAGMLSVEQLAELLQVSRDTIYRLAKRGELPGRKVGHMWRFSGHAIEEYVCQGSKPIGGNAELEGEPIPTKAKE